jgi:hypothetical protein
MVTRIGINNLYDKTPENEKETRITLFCEELLEKEVKLNFGYGRIYLPREWVGKKVKVVRID